MSWHEFSFSRKKKHQDEVDHNRVVANETQRLMNPQQHNVNYTQPRGHHIDPQLVARMEQERYQREQEQRKRHRERVDKIRKKYNIPGDRYVRT